MIVNDSIIRKILIQKAKRFRTTFSEDAKDLYFDNNKLLHPAEFGRYREKLASDFLHLFSPKYIDISTGFIVSPTNEISTQCDVILYDRELTPLIQDDQSNQFFPSDCVKAIGEIKSDLTKPKLLDALLKLSKVKKTSHSTCIDSLGDSGEKYYRLNYRDHVFSFLICNKIIGDISTLAEDISDFYHHNNIENQYRHSFILSLDGNSFFYQSNARGRCGHAFSSEDGDDINGNTPTHEKGFEESVIAFAQTAYISLMEQQRVIINLIEYIKPNGQEL